MCGNVNPEEVWGWFFDIYIQGSKYNFLELSLNQEAPIFESEPRVSVIEKSLVERPEQIDQATKSA
jgi:hypothetical protein